MNSLFDTFKFIQKAHANQTDKVGEPYCMHPLEVMLLMSDNASLIKKHVALLHDVLEDTEYTRENLKEMGYTEEIVNAVKLLTRKKEGQTYAEYINSIIESKNEIALDVKVSDLLHNLNPVRLSYLPAEKAASLHKRYVKALNKIANSGKSSI